MIVIDTSALAAIFFEEPEGQAFAERIAADDAPTLSAGTLLECSIVFRTADRRARRPSDSELDDFLAVSNVTVTPVSGEQISIARDAYRRFGKGMGHPAQLNFGDCMVYGVAKAEREPLLFKGSDFSQTDIEPALKD